MSQYAKCPTNQERLDAELDRLKRFGLPFSPANLAKKFNMDAKEVSSRIRYRDDVYRISKAQTTRSGFYQCSVWGFREVSA
jgi:hypothetical protein